MFVRKKKYEELSRQFQVYRINAKDAEAVADQHYQSSLEAIRQQARQIGELSAEIERVSRTPQTKANTEAAYARGIADAHRNMGRYLLTHMIPVSTGTARELVAAARELRHPLPSELDENQENDQ